jgi:HEAT repeat protein
MSKARGVDELLARLSALRGRAEGPEARELIFKGLASKSNIVAAKAADVARELKLAGICPELEDAFARFLRDPKSPDKGCAAKTALARAALELECPAEELFRAGIRHVQMEGSYGAPTDAAAELRGLCALGLVQVRSRGAMNEVVELLSDRETTARVGAVRALAYAGKEEGALVLRFKALNGDREPAVIGECLTALLSLQPDEALPFVERFLDGPDEVLREEAALALGTSRRPLALELIRRGYSRARDRRFRQILLTAAASLRFPEAIEFLVSVVESDRPDAAADALQALGIHRSNSGLRERLATIIANRADLTAVFQKTFG